MHGEHRVHSMLVPPAQAAGSWAEGRPGVPRTPQAHGEVPATISRNRVAAYRDQPSADGARPTRARDSVWVVLAPWAAGDTPRRLARSLHGSQDIGTRYSALGAILDFMICRLCKRDAQLIDAHVIPRPFFGEVDGGKQSAKVLANGPDQYPKRLPIGFYDPQLLCAKCDNEVIGRWDEYGVQVLLQERELLVPQPNVSAPVAFVRQDYDYTRLKLFFLSVLWRANESSLPFFDQVRLGPYRQPLFDMISAGDPGPSETFSVLLSVFTSKNAIPVIGTPILDPHRERWDGVNAYRLSFGVVTAYVKVDRATFGESFSRLILKPNEPLTLIAREFGEASEHRVARSIARSPHNRRAFRRDP